MLTVHLRVTDTGTGKPTPVRLRITDPGGTHFAPLGRLTEFATAKNEDVGGHLRLGQERWCYIDGACEVRLPAGVPLRVQSTKGPEYRPLDETVTLGPGQMALRFGVERWSNIRAGGWVPGDIRAHFLTPHAAVLEAAAEDLAFVQLLARAQPLLSLDGTAYPTVGNLLAFSGQQPAVTSGEALVAVNTLNEHPVLGRVGLLHCHRPVYPLTFGGSDDTDDWSECDWCDQCHRKKGLTVWVDPFEPVSGVTGGEALVALLLGKIDALEYDGRRRRQPLLPWLYRLLDLGFRVPLVGGSGKVSNTTPLGTLRTYARHQTGEPVTLAGWVEAIRAGRCFVTNGPLLTLDADGIGPGDRLDPTPGRRVVVRATAYSWLQFDRLELVWNGEVVAAERVTNDAPPYRAVLETSLPADEPGWLAARCVGGTTGHPLHGQPVFAHTAAVWFGGGKRPRQESEAGATALRRAIDSTREWALAHGRYADPKWKAQLVARCDEALGRLV